MVNSGGDQYVYASGIAAFTTVSSGGTEVVYSGGMASETLVESGGDEAVEHSGMAFAATVLGGGTETVLSAGIVSGTTVSSGGAIDLPDLAYSGMQPVLSGDTLTVTEGGASYTQVLSGNYDGLNFVATDDLGSGTLLTLEPALSCFAAGTRILTETGEVAVEALRTGDQVILRDGTAAPVIWIGHRTVDCQRHPEPEAVWPVRVARHAFGPDLPRRDLYLSTDHAVFVQDVLIPIRHLINGTTIAPTEMPRVTWFHVELPRHEVLFAEGLPAESYLDTGDRANFANGGGNARLFADFSARMWEAAACAPLIVTGPKLAAVRRMIAERATPQDDWRIRPGLAGRLSFR
jgi:autotransporter passenger strand-loop-strand repeat protein